MFQAQMFPAIGAAWLALQGRMSDQMEHLLGKTAIITGASRGIGEAAARYFAKLGAKVVLAARSKAHIDAIAGDLCSAGYQATAKRCDVRDN